MPTGYTYPVAEGKVTEFSEFAMSCARAFGALAAMRDDPSDAPIPEEFTPSTYHVDALAKAQARLTQLRAMTPEDAAVDAEAAFQKETASADAYDASNAEQDRRMEAMEARVLAWTPPTTEHARLKSFMLEQLGMSKHGDYRAHRPEKLTAQKFVEAETARAMRDVEYHAAEQAKEIERAKSRTEWVASLRASLAQADGPVRT